MLAVTTPDALSVVDPSLLKKAPSSIPSCLCLLYAPTASFWSPDNSFLYISSAHTIHKYDPLSNILRDVYTSDNSEPIRHLVTKDRSTVIFDTGDKIHVLECGSNPKVSQIYETQKASVTSLSLSNDNTLLASTSANGVHVHNLTLGSHSVLRGLSLGGQDINTSAFHPHCRTRLLVAAGKQIIIYDTTRPSGPMKTITLAEAASGTITAIACSPFSKTLIAAATSGGFVGLIDLEKEKALFRTLNVKVPLTTIGFSSEGAAIYLGTEHGKILVIDLRALDKPPKAVVVSEIGSRIETISIQKKAKSGTEGSTKTPADSAATTTTKSPTEPLPTIRRAASTTVTQATRPIPKLAPSPARPRVAKVGVVPSPAGRKISSKEARTPNSTLKRAATTSNIETKKKVFSPVRDPHGNSGSTGDISVQLDDLANLQRGKADTTPVKEVPTDNRRTRPSPSARNATPTIITGPMRLAKNTEEENPRRARTLPTTTVSNTTTRTRKTSTTDTKSPPAREGLVVPRTQLGSQRRPRAGPSASPTNSDVTSALSSATNKLIRPAASASRPSPSASRPESSISRSRGSKRGPTPISTATITASQTPSPDLPDPHMESTTPVTVQTKKKTMQVLGLGTPEVDRWIRAGQEDQRRKRSKFADGDVQGKAKTVGFKEDDEESDKEALDHDDGERERERSLTMQVSPRRPSVNASAAQSWAASPIPNASHTGGVPGGPGGSSAHELLKTIVQDVMYDFQRDTKAEMMGLHLDLVRMGRGWKTELRSLMDEYVGDLKDLRDENRRLRLENERLRRGTY